MKNLYESAKAALNNHQVIAFPTETVFGLGVYYDDEDELISMEKNFINMYIERDESKYEAKMLSYKIIKNINDSQ